MFLFIKESQDKKYYGEKSPKSRDRNISGSEISRSDNPLISEIKISRYEKIENQREKNPHIYTNPKSPGEKITISLKIPTPGIDILNSRNKNPKFQKS